MNTVTTAEQTRDECGRDFRWPRKVEVFGVRYTPTTYDDAARTIIDAAKRGIRGTVSCHAVHALVTFSGDPRLRAIANEFDMVTPDGQPVRWALNLLHGTRLADRVYGPELMRRVCAQASANDVPVYLYGGSPDVRKDLPERLNEMFPGLRVVGSESPPYRPLTSAENEQVVNRINTSGAGIVFIGLGCPKQDTFAFANRRHIRGVQICVGAAFDFHAGAKSMAPAWMQRAGLEWSYRLFREPRRLWRRYLMTNSVFVTKLGWTLLRWPTVMRQRRSWRAALDVTTVAVDGKP